MNAATAIALAAVIIVLLTAAYGTYTMIRNRPYCADCPHKDSCNDMNPINCTIRRK